MKRLTNIDHSLSNIKNILGIFLGILLLYLMRELSNLVVPLVFALFFAVLFQPIVKSFTRFLSLGMSLALTIFVTLLIFFFIGFGLFNVIQTLVSNSDNILNSISSDLRPFINNNLKFLGISLEEKELRDALGNLLQSSSFWSASGSFFNTMSSFTAELLMTILYFAGLLSAIFQFDKTIQYLVKDTTPKKPSPKNSISEEEKILQSFTRIKDSVSSYIKVKTLISLITGIAVGIICWLFGIDYALLWGFIAFALNYIPYIGSLIAIIPPIILGIIDSFTFSQLIFLFICLEGIQLIMGNVVEPRWMGDSFSINTVSVLFGFVFWAFMWGTIGMLLSVPLTFMFKVILEHMGNAHFVVRLMEKKS